MYGWVDGIDQREMCGKWGELALVRENIQDYIGESMMDANLVALWINFMLINLTISLLRAKELGVCIGCHQQILIWREISQKVWWIASYLQMGGGIYGETLFKILR